VARYTFLKIKDFLIWIWISGELLGTGHYLWRGVAPKRNVFLGRNFSDPTIKKSKHLITQPQISIKK
jgi:hypothetical protein